MLEGTFKALGTVRSPQTLIAMQWLALRVRFVEPLPRVKDLLPQDIGKRRWVELEKVGEIVEEMRRLGREAFVVEMGIGSVGQKR
ncbi:hypothetical protein BDY19DRAFT_988938 [Irpex rosettiformis]|uniref:Uncharacterized protein n=1 Tax=Irpex rosettiformis TaxID=378272 RepID=A0ACB8ULF1_9APHY|nr:hypothetical protein BDY19DRAFT_988938 [Irpex rosettiformis]